MNRYFINDPHQPRVRRAADAVAVVVGVVLVVWTAFTSDSVLVVEEALLDLSGSFPTWFDQIYRVAYSVGALMVLVLFVAVLFQGSRHLDLLRDMALALVVSFGLSLLLVWLVDGTFPVVFSEFSTADPEPVFPVLRVAMVTGVIAVSGPQLARPIRRFGWVMVILVAISAFGLGFGLPGDALGGIGVGVAAAGAVLLVFGSPSGYPNTDEIVAGLMDLGLPVSDLGLTRDQSWGVRRFSGVLDGGEVVEVKAYGRDATDSQVLSKAWRTVWYREEGQQFTFSRLQGVEHEALAMLIARRSDVEVPMLHAVGVGGDDIALLAVSLRGQPLDPESLSQFHLVDVWRQVSRLHDAKMAHGGLTLDAITRDDSTPVLRELNAASFNASDARLALDVVSLLYETAVHLGPEIAVGAAADGLGDARLGAALPYLQSPALSKDQRKLVDKPNAIVKELQEAVAAATNTELPEPAKLRRIRWQDLVIPALSLVALGALMGLLSDIDFAAVWAVVQDANWAWIVIGFLIGQFVFFPEATGMLFATGYKLPLRPLVILQVSVKWIGLAIPSAAGRVTMNTLFLRRFGVPPTIALTQGAIDGVSGFVVEFGILLVAFLASDITIDTNTSEIRWELILLIVALLIGIGVIVVLRTKRFRDMVIPVVADAWQLLWGVLKDPKRALGLLLSNLASRLILSVTLWFILQAIDEPLPLVTCLVVTVATNLLAGLVPIPGGIGVAEAVLTSFLVMAGLGVDEAFAAAVVFRVATFYIPAGEGFFALRWLKARDYV